MRGVAYPTEASFLRSHHALRPRRTFGGFQPPPKDQEKNEIGLRFQFLVSDARVVRPPIASGVPFWMGEFEVIGTVEFFNPDAAVYENCLISDVTTAFGLQRPSCTLS